MRILEEDILKENVAKDGSAYSILISINGAWYGANFIAGKVCAHTHRKYPWTKQIKSAVIALARERVAKLPKNWHKLHNELYGLN